MARSAADSRTSMWVKTVQPDPVEDADAPLDFSKKKARSPDADGNDTNSEDGSTASSCNGTPATMANGNPLLRPGIGSLLPSLPNLPSFFSANLLNQANKNSKPVRPFKAYPRDPLSLPLGLYGFPMNLGLTGNILESLSPQLLNGNKELYKQLQRSAEKNQKSEPKKARKSGKKVENGVPNGHYVVSSSVRTGPSRQEREKSNPSDNATMSPKSADSAAITTTGSPAAADNSRSESKTPDPNSGEEEGGKGKKRARSVPDDVKDEAYWERRRKNNEAAKRSRDARRNKEDEIAQRAFFLEQENMQLRVQVQQLKGETERLRVMLFSS